MERAMFLPRKLRLAQKRWFDLVNPDEHRRLQQAMMKELYYRKAGRTDDGEEVADFDPLEGYF